MTLRRLALVALLATTTVSSIAAVPAAPKISLATLKQVDKTLSDDSFEGRAPTTPAEAKTIKYIAERFARAGLKPGNKGSWYQDVPLVEMTVDPSVHLAITGGKEPIDLAYKTDMVIATYQVQPKVELKDSDLVFVGYGINAPEKGWNDYAGIDVKGKTVVILINDPDYQNKTLDGPFEGRAMTYYGRWTYKYEEAARQGAAGAIIVHDTEPAAYGFNVVRSSWTGPQLQFDQPDNHMDQSKAIGWVTNEAAHKLFAAAGQNLDTLSAAAKVKGFKAVPLSGLKASATLINSIRRQKSHNVVGILPGKKAPGEVVLYSAHWDHLGRCEPVNGDDICNGAADNASGVAALVALAETYKAAPQTRRSIVFLAVTAEESGLLGSAYYAAHPVFPLRNTVGGVNMDELNLFGATKDVVVTGAGKSELEDMLKPLATAQHRAIKPEPTPEKGHYYRSDHFSFAKYGVPMAAFGSGDDLVKGGEAAGRAAAEDFNEHRYHAPDDEYNPNWDWSGALQDLTLYYQMGRELADSNLWPNWYKSSEFRKIRDKSRAGK